MYNAPERHACNPTPQPLPERHLEDAVDNGDRDHDTQPSNENEPDTEDESAVSEDSELSLFGHTELAGWQTESKAD